MSAAVIADELEVAHVLDPLAGSYYVESLTSKLEAEAEKSFAEVERRGGVVPAILDGYFQSEIHRSAVRYQRATESGRKKIVGVNTYVEDDDGVPAIDIHRIDPASEREAKVAIAKLRSERDGAAARRELDAIRRACQDGGNLLERFVAAAHAYCTLGEIAQVLREEFGEFQEPKIL